MDWFAFRDIAMNTCPDVREGTEIDKPLITASKKINPLTTGQQSTLVRLMENPDLTYSPCSAAKVSRLHHVIASIALGTVLFLRLFLTTHRSFFHCSLTINFF